MFDEFRWTKASEKRNHLTSIYEPIQINLLRALASRCTDAIFLDIGANIGVCSIMLSKENTLSEFHAFEALKSLSTEMQKNLALNNLGEKIKVHQVVLSDEVGEVEFIVRSDFAGDGGVRETHEFLYLPFDRIDMMQKISLDEIVNVSGRDIVAKIDVEGHELKVLHGAKEMLQNNKGFLQIEILKKDLFPRTEGFLKSLGWHRLFVVDNDYYFSNVATFDGAASRLEGCLEQFVARSRSGVGRAARRHIMSGVVLEMRQSYVRRVKQFMGRRA